MSKANDVNSDSDNTRYKRLFETAQDGILILNYPNGEIIDANPYILKLLDCQLSDVINKKLWEIGFIKDKQQALYLFDDLIDKGYLRYENLNLMKLNGEPIDVELICNVYSVNSDMVIQCNIREISERVHARLLEQQILLLKIKNLDEIISCLSAVVESRDSYTSGHQYRVADLATRIAQFMKLSEFQTNGVRLAASLHDVGKFRIPLELLVKPSELTTEEYNLIKLHPQAGAEILKTVSFEQDVPRFILEHHERLDGSGYPNGLKDPDISLEAKIIAVTDVMEAMTSFRPYRAPLALKQALHELLVNQGKLYDVDVVSACMHLIINDNYSFPVPKVLEKLQRSLEK